MEWSRPTMELFDICILLLFDVHFHFIVSRLLKYFMHFGSVQCESTDIWNIEKSSTELSVLHFKRSCDHWNEKRALFEHYSIVN